MRVSKVLAILVVGALAAPALSFAADERTQNAVDARQGLLKVVRSYFGPIVGMAREQIPYDAAVVEKNANAIAALLPMIPDLFSMDTSESDAETGALEEIWDDYDDFTAKHPAFEESRVVRMTELAHHLGHHQVTKAEQTNSRCLEVTDTLEAKKNQILGAEKRIQEVMVMMSVFKTAFRLSVSL